MKPSTGPLSAIIGTLSAIDRNHCPLSIGTGVRNRWNPHFGSPAVAAFDWGDLASLFEQSRVIDPATIEELIALDPLE
jgi:hypothetical protein